MLLSEYAWRQCLNLLALMMMMSENELVVNFNCVC